MSGSRNERSTEGFESPFFKGLAILALLKLTFHLATSSGYGIFRDELYYIACSERLALGYVDHPPLSIALLWAARHTLGDSLPAIRFLAALAGAATVVLSMLIARELGGRRGAQLLAGLTAFFAPQYLAVSHTFSMNGFDVVFWAALELIAIRALLRDQPRQWLWFGLVAGVGLQNKYSVAFLAMGLGVGLLLTPQRRHFFSPWMWLGGASAALIFAPHVWWQVQNGWPTLEFMARASAEKNLPVGPLDFFAGQIVLLHPVAAPLWLLGLGSLLFAPALSSVRALGITYLATFALLVSQQGKVYYLGPIYPMLLAAGAVVFERVVQRSRVSWTLPATTTLYVAAAIAILPMAVPLLPVETFIVYQRLLGVSEPRMERQDLGELPQLYADMHGWQELVDTVARVHREMPPQRRESSIVLTRNYGEAGAIEFLGKPRDLPPVIAGHNNFYLWGPGNLRDSDTVITVGHRREDLVDAFESVEEVARVQCRYCVPRQNDLPVHLARGMVTPVEELWRRLKRFI
jgi:hypothetical protein